MVTTGFECVGKVAVTLDVEGVGVQGSAGASKDGVKMQKMDHSGMKFERMTNPSWLVRSSFRFSVLGSATAAAFCLLTGFVAAAPDDDSFFTHIHTDKAMANVTVSPGRSGSVDIAIQLETVDETPMKAKGVSVTLADTQTGRKRPTMVATRSGEDGWQVTATSLSAGKWMLGLDISISDTDEVKVESLILIK